MAELNLPMKRTTGQRLGSAAISAPRLVMSWEDWLTFAIAFVTFVSVGVSIDRAEWVPNMPAVWPTIVAGLLVGLFASRIRLPGVVIQPVALALGAIVVVLAVQSYADGLTFGDRLADFRVRMVEWYDVVRAGDISNDNLPFVTLVHTATFLSAYMAAWSIYRWHNAWLAVVPGGVVLLSNISFMRGQPSGAFVVFLFGAILLLGRAHLQRNQLRWRRQGVEYPDFISLNAVQLTVIMTTLLILGAWMVPLGKQADAIEGTFDAVAKPLTDRSEDFVRLFHNIDSRKGAPLHSFGNTLPIRGQVKLGTKSLFEVKAAQPGLIRATSYDEYTGTGWKSTGRQTNRVSSRGALPEVPPESVYKKRTVSVLNVELMDDESTILTAGTPLATNVDVLVDVPKGQDSNVDIERIRSRRALRSGDSYNSIGSESTATAEELVAAGTDYPEWLAERYLQLPDTLPDRVREEAQRITAGVATPYEKAVAVETYLRDFPYELMVEAAPPKTDAVDFFLFTQKAGYFDYHATALAVMLRSVGVPARIAVGYVLDPATAQETTYIVRKQDAYSWVEVFFPEYGWVNFNPTPDRPAGGAGGIGTGTAGGATTDFPTLEDLFPLEGGEIITPFPEEIGDVLQEEPVIQNQPPWMLIWTMAAVLALLVVALAAGRITWNWGLGSLQGRAQLWAKTQRVAGWTGLGTEGGETPSEWSRRMGSAVGAEEDAATLSRAYEEARYGRPEQQRIPDEEATGAYIRLRNALFGKLFRYGKRGTNSRG